MHRGRVPARTVVRMRPHVVLFACLAVPCLLLAQIVSCAPVYDGNNQIQVRGVGVKDIKLLGKQSVHIVLASPHDPVVPSGVRFGDPNQKHWSSESVFACLVERGDDAVQLVELVGLRLGSPKRTPHVVYCR